MADISEILGWAGVALMLVAYYLVSADKLSSQSAHYQMANFLGGALVAWNSVYAFAWPAVAANAAWALIALLALIALYKSSKRSL